MARSPEVIIGEITTLREKNNIVWMNLLKIAFREAPEEAKDIVRRITEYDSQITELTRELCEISS